MLPSFRVACAGALAVAVAGCGRPARPDQVPGTYVMNRGRAADTLVVRAGGTYVRRYRAPGRPPATDSGTWGVESGTDERLLGFENFSARWRAETFADGRDTVRGLWLVAAERGPLGAVRLPVEPDLGWAYVRVRGP